MNHINPIILYLFILGISISSDKKETHNIRCIHGISSELAIKLLLI